MIKLDEPATLENFDEDRYLSSNPDVRGYLPSPYQHLINHGIAEGRTIRRSKAIVGLKAKKIDKIKQITKRRMPYTMVDNPGGQALCFLDDKLIHDVSYAATKPLYATASLAKRANEVVLKVVNVSTTDLETDLQLEGGKILPTATAIVLASDKPEDENTLEQPTKVKPMTSKLNNAGATFRHTFPANSVTVLRLKLK